MTTFKTILIVLIFGLIKISYSQVYDSLYIGAGICKNTNHTQFHDYWKPGISSEVVLGTNFYYGNLYLGFDFASYKAKNTTQPDFKAISLFLQWEKIWEVKNKIHVGPGFETFFWQMHFSEDHPNAIPSLLVERELGLGANFIVKYHLTELLDLECIYNYRHIYTAKSIHFQNIKFRIKTCIGMPGWLRKIVK